MKNLKNNSSMFRLLAIVGFFCIIPNLSATAQEAPSEEDSVAIAAEEESGKTTSRLALTTTQLAGDMVELQALLRAKIEGAWQPVSDKKVQFFHSGDETETPLGEATTDAKGFANIRANVKNTALNAAGYLSFAARYGGNDALEESDADGSIQKASLTMSAVKGDSSYTIKLKAAAPSAEGEIPLAEAEIAVFVKRMVGVLKVGEGTTDENGEAEIEFPGDLPGDEAGNLYISAKIEDFGEYGNLLAETTQPWGRPVLSNVEQLPRALWGIHPPVWMIVTFFVLMSTVWGHYAVIVYKLFRIKKEGKMV